MPRPSRAPVIAAAAGAAAASSGDTQLRYPGRVQPAATPAGSRVPKSPVRRPNPTPESAADAPRAKAPRLETTSKSAGAPSATGGMSDAPQGPPPKGYGPRAVAKRPPPSGGMPDPKRSRRVPDHLVTWWRHNLELSEWGPRYWSYHLRAWIYVNDDGDEYVHVRDLGPVRGIQYAENYAYEAIQI